MCGVLRNALGGLFPHNEYILKGHFKSVKAGYALSQESVAQFLCDCGADAYVYGCPWDACER